MHDASIPQSRPSRATSRSSRAWTSPPTTWARCWPRRARGRPDRRGAAASNSTLIWGHFSALHTTPPYHTTTPPHRTAPTPPPHPVWHIGTWCSCAVNADWRLQSDDVANSFTSSGRTQRRRAQRQPRRRGHGGNGRAEAQRASTADVLLTIHPAVLGAVRCALLRAHAHRVLTGVCNPTGACNPMLCPGHSLDLGLILPAQIRVFRRSRRLAC